MGAYTGILNTLIGSLLGFLFAIAIFNITEKRKMRLQKMSLAKNLLNEIEFNLVANEKARKKLATMVNYAKEAYTDSKKKYEPEHGIFTRFQDHFFHESLRNGLLYELCDTETIFRIISTLDAINSWPEFDAAMSPSSVLGALAAQQQILRTYNRMLDTIHEKAEAYSKNT